MGGRVDREIELNYSMAEVKQAIESVFAAYSRYTPELKTSNALLNTYYFTVLGIYFCGIDITLTELGPNKVRAQLMCMANSELFHINRYLAEVLAEYLDHLSQGLMGELKPREAKPLGEVINGRGCLKIVLGVLILFFILALVISIWY